MQAFPKMLSISFRPRSNREKHGTKSKGVPGWTGGPALLGEVQPRAAAVQRDWKGEPIPSTWNDAARYSH